MGKPFDRQRRPAGSACTTGPCQPLPSLARRTIAHPSSQPKPPAAKPLGINRRTLYRKRERHEKTSRCHAARATRRWCIRPLIAGQAHGEYHGQR
ncbi:MAG: helix-turn-helix domain-containing protein [Polyangiales bacterium]